MTVHAISFSSYSINNVQITENTHCVIHFPLQVTFWTLKWVLHHYLPWWWWWFCQPLHNKDNKKRLLDPSPPTLSIWIRAFQAARWGAAFSSVDIWFYSKPRSVCLAFQKIYITAIRTHSPAHISQWETSLSIPHVVPNSTGSEGKPPSLLKT